ncbi:MAG: hypothetical protein NC200_00950 [Candidatus Gastranaerophilales bacterium]|nr:hypothetical protein [Candidatus Gastranaerophilales bacterium]
MTTIIRTCVNIENEIKAIKQLEAEIKNLSDLKKEKESHIKAIMEQTGMETMDIAGYVVRYTKYLKNQLNTSLLKKLDFSIYSKYLRQVETTKFTIS